MISRHNGHSWVIHRYGTHTCTYPMSHHQAFQQQLDAYGVSLAYTGESESRRYYRVMKTLDMTSEGERKRVLDMI